MKEFAEKLIERLDKIKGNEPSLARIVWNNAVNMCIREVDQLAEEYNNTSTDISTDELISKKMLVEKIWEKRKEHEEMYDIWTQDDIKDLFCDIVALIDEFPTTHNQDSTKKNQGWILCSERLPEKRSWYLALFKESSTGFVGLPYIADYLMGNHTNWTTKDGWIIKDCTDSDKANEYFKDLECVAWQPLPNPCSFTHEKELVEFCKPEEKPKFSNEELDRIMDKILDTTQEKENFYSERFNRVI